MATRRESPGRRGVGYYRIHFLESIRPDGVVSLECSKLLKAFGSHLRFLHHVALDDFDSRARAAGPAHARPARPRFRSTRLD
jgi:hypothetical protein